MNEKLTRYRYSGPQSGVTLRQVDGTEKEVLLHNGAEVSLPADHPWVVKAARKGHLTLITPQPPSIPPYQGGGAKEGADSSPAAKPVKAGKEVQSNAG